MVTVADRVAPRIERRGEHELWTGATDTRGVGLVSSGGRTTTVRRVVWETAHGPLSQGARVTCTCSAAPACVRVDHLSVARAGAARDRRIDKAVQGVADVTRGRARKGTGSIRKVRPGMWELRVTVGRWDDGRPRTLSQSVKAPGKTEALEHLAAFVDEMRSVSLPDSRNTRDISLDEAVAQFLTEHLLEEKGRAEKTVGDYSELHRKWFSPAIGSQLVRRVDTATMDHLFGEMRKAGLSHSRLNQAKSLYAPFFRWAKRRGMTSRNPMAEFELPTSTYSSRERTPPEVEELCLLLATAVAVVPDVAPILVLGAVTGMRRGELVAVRRSGIGWAKGRITVDSAISESGKVKTTKTRRERTFHLDDDTVAMLRRHCDDMDQRASTAGIALAPDPFLFSLLADCSQPTPPDHLTRRVSVLKGHLGIEDKRPGVATLEDEALRLRRLPPSPRPAGKPGPTPQGGMSYRDIAQRLGRSERWAYLAVESAQRREAARAGGHVDVDFDGSILALRKFTSSELLDAGFNLSMVAQRQGHGPQVLARHYARSRASADKKAAEHLGRVVHRPAGAQT